jgi:gliding motility-associated-like protein
LEQGVFSDTIGFSPYFDGMTEGNESVIFNIVTPNACDGTFDTTSTIVQIIDYIPMTITSEDSLNICSDNGETAALWCNVSNGVPPYIYTWNPDFSYPNNDSITVYPSNLEPNLNTYTVSVVDQCLKTIESNTISVYNQCELVVPNVLTLNNDNVNEFFIIEHLDDYDAVKLQVFNRWGNLIYENENYANDWSGTTKSGQVLNDGVYFYMVTPTSEKYEYDDQEKTLRTLHGFFQIIK